MYTSVCPILPSRDFTTTIEFYQSLGFVVGALYDAQGYLILERDQVELHFFRADAHIADQSDHGAFVRVTDANELSRHYQDLQLPDHGIPRVTLAEDKPWGVCEFAIVDPDGNLLRVGHLLPSGGDKVEGLS